MTPHYEGNEALRIRLAQYPAEVFPTAVGLPSDVLLAVLIERGVLHEECTEWKQFGEHWEEMQPGKGHVIRRRYVTEPTEEPA